MFVVERIKSMAVTDRPYQLPLGFDLDAFVQDSLTVMRGLASKSNCRSTKRQPHGPKDRTRHPSQRLTPLRADG